MSYEQPKNAAESETIIALSGLDRSRIRDFFYLNESKLTAVSGLAQHIIDVIIENESLDLHPAGDFIVSSLVLIGAAADDIVEKTCEIQGIYRNKTNLRRGQ